MNSSIKLRKNNNKSTSSKRKALTNENRNKEMLLAIEDTKNYYQIYYSNPNPLFLSQLKTKILNIFLSHYNLNDISVISKILKKYNYFETINLGPYDPKKNSQKTTRIRNGKGREPITEGEKNKKEKEKKDKEIESLNIINRIIDGLGKHLSLSEKIKNLTITNFEFVRNLALNLSNGIINNKSIEKLSINNCKISIDNYEILLKGLLNHEKIQYLNLSNNIDFDDKYGDIIGRIISRQTYRRDLAIWLCGLRNEKPLTNDYTLGLISINLNGNKLSNLSAESITTSLASDQYIRSIILTNNSFERDACKKFIYMLRRNLTLLNVDLRGNPGYDENIKYRLVLKMSKNIRYLYYQFQNKVFTLSEYKKFTKFIDTSFYATNIPEEIIKQFNDNIHSDEGKLEMPTNINQKNNMSIKIQDKSNIINKGKNNSIEKDDSTNKKINSREKNISHPSINSNSKNKKINIIKHNNLSESKKNKKQGIIINNKIYNKNNKSLSIDKNYTNKLLQENLLLKRKIIEFKAKEIQKKLGKQINLPDNNDNLENNFNEIDELLDKLNKVINPMKIKNNTKFINNKNVNKNEERKNNNINKNELKNYNKNEDSINEKEEKFNNIDYFDII